AGRADRRDRRARGGHQGPPLEPPDRRRRAQAQPDPGRDLQGRLSVTVKWVKVDPLVMNGEPFCYGSRLTVRQLLQLRQSGRHLPATLAGIPARPSQGTQALLVMVLVLAACTATPTPSAPGHVNLGIANGTSPRWRYS